MITLVPDDEEELLVPLEDYLKAGVHIGTTTCTSSMKNFVYRKRSDGLNIINIPMTDTRIRIVSKTLARYNHNEIVIVSTKIFKNDPVAQFAQFLNSDVFSGRFIPGTFANPDFKTEFKFIEPKIVIVTNPAKDLQAIKEANMVGIPIIALVDSDNKTNGLDLVIPCNNKERNSIYLIFWLLAVEYFRLYGSQ